MAEIVEHPEVLLYTRIRKSPYFYASRRHGVEMYSFYNHMYHPRHYGDPVAEYWELLNGVTLWDEMAVRPAAEQIGALAQAVDRLTKDFGGWQVPWGQINRFQRINDDIAPHFDDTKPSIPVPFTASVWGSLAAFGARAYPNTKQWYGTSGNSFVAVVEFGDSVRAQAITAGGESGSPQSPHFNDEAERYASGRLRDVYFYRSQLVGHTEREYHP